MSDFRNQTLSNQHAQALESLKKGLARGGVHEFYGFQVPAMRLDNVKGGQSTSLIFNEIHFNGSLDLENCEEFEISFSRCTFQNDITVKSSALNGITFSNCIFKNKSLLVQQSRISNSGLVINDRRHGKIDIEIVRSEISVLSFLGSTVGVLTAGSSKFAKFVLAQVICGIL